MTRELPTQRVEVSFVGVPPAQQIERPSGVSEVEVDGPIVRCLTATVRLAPGKVARITGGF